MAATFWLRQATSPSSGGFPGTIPVVAVDWQAWLLIMLMDLVLKCAQSRSLINRLASVLACSCIISVHGTKML